METEGRIIFTFKIFTEAPGNYLIACLNIPDFLVPCTDKNKCAEQCRKYLDFLISVRREGLIKDYTSARFVDDGWHFQLIYTSESLTYVNKYEGEKKSLRAYMSNIDYNAILIRSKMQFVSFLLSIPNTFRKDNNDSLI